MTVVLSWFCFDAASVGADAVCWSGVETVAVNESVLDGHVLECGSAVVTVGSADVGVVAVVLIAVGSNIC